MKIRGEHVDALRHQLMALLGVDETVMRSAMVALFGHAPDYADLCAVTIDDVTELTPGAVRSKVRQAMTVMAGLSPETPVCHGHLPWTAMSGYVLEGECPVCGSLIDPSDAGRVLNWVTGRMDAPADWYSVGGRRYPVGGQPLADVRVDKALADVLKDEGIGIAEWLNNRRATLGDPDVSLAETINPPAAWSVRPGAMRDAVRNAMRQVPRPVVGAAGVSTGTGPVALSNVDKERLISIAVQADRRLLLADVHKGYRGSLPGYDRPNDQARSDVYTLCRVGRLLDGSWPLRQYIAALARMSHDAEDVAFLTGLLGDPQTTTTTTTVIHRVEQGGVGVVHGPVVMTNHWKK